MNEEDIIQEYYVNIISGKFKFSKNLPEGHEFLLKNHELALFYLKQCGCSHLNPKEINCLNIDAFTRWACNTAYIEIRTSQRKIIENIPNFIKGDLNLINSNISGLPNLISVSGDLLVGNLHINEFPSLNYVGGLIIAKWRASYWFEYFKERDKENLSEKVVVHGKVRH